MLKKIPTQISPKGGAAKRRALIFSSGCGDWLGFRERWVGGWQQMDVEKVRSNKTHFNSIQISFLIFDPKLRSLYTLQRS